MARARVPRRLRPADDEGASLVVVLLCLPVLLLMASFAVDTAHWYVHKRHLQTQADSGALAAARDLQFPCSGTTDSQIALVAHKYDGTGAVSPYNQQPADGTNSASVTALINQPFFFRNAGDPSFPSTADTTDDGSPLTGRPCPDKAIDLKLTETNTPWWFSLVGLPKYIDAQARVTAQKLVSSAGSAPIAIQSSTPNSVHATFVDEVNGTSLGSAELSTADSGKTWTTASAVPVSFNGVGSRVGVRIGLSGNSTAGSACGSGTNCFDSTLPNNGVSLLHTWADPGGTVGLPIGNGKTPVGPLVKESWLTSSGCVAVTFSTSDTPCTVVLHADLVFAAGDTTCSNPPATTSPVIVNLTVSGAAVPQRMICPSLTNATGVWTSAPIVIASNSGPTSFQLDYFLQSGEQKPAGATGGNNANPSVCTANGNNNTCVNNGSQNGFGTIAQRFFAGAPNLSAAASSRSGTISGVTVTDRATSAPVPRESVQRCSGAAVCTKNLDVTVSIYPLASTTDINATAINLRTADPQGNGAIDCGQGVGASQYRGALINGCPNVLSKAPSGSTSAVCATAPNECVGVVAGNGKVTDQLDDRIACALGCTVGDGSVGQSSVPLTTCDNPNFWSPPNMVDQLLKRTPADPRLVQLVVVPYGALLPNGTYDVPIQDFASFYITGYGATGSQLNCGTAVVLPGTYASANQGPMTYVRDTPASTIEVWGHFVVYTSVSAGGTGTGTCDPSVASDCTTILTK